MSGSASFSWTGTTSGAWDTPANWADVTTGQTPAVVAPGSLDVVTVNNGTLTDNGDAASLTFLGTDAISGDLNTGTLSVAAASILNIGTTGTVAANAATVAGTVVVNGRPAALLVNGPLQVSTAASSQAELLATNGGLIQTGNLILNNAVVYVDSSSTIELGIAGTAEAPSLTIDPGYTLSGIGTVADWGFPAPELAIVDNGLISGTDLTLGSYTPIVEGESPGVSPIVINFPDVTLSGTGTVEVAAGGAVSLAANVFTPGLTFQLDGNAELATAGGMVAGTTINLDGDGNTLSLWTDPDFAYVGFPAIDATINGFNGTDAIIVNNTTITSATLSGGSLAVALGPFGDSTTTLDLAGNYSGDGVSVLSGNEVVLTGDTYSWIGPSAGGNWDSAANWADVTAGETPAVAAPGSLNVVTVAGTSLNGSGDAASVTFLGSDAVVGELNTGTLAVAQDATLDINAGATISAATATDAATIAVTGNAAALLVSGLIRVGTGSDAGALSASSDALIRTGDLVFGTNDANQLAVDASSTIEIGNLGSAAADAVTVDPGYTLSGSAVLTGNLVDNGLVSGGNLTLGLPYVYAGGHGASTYSGSEFTSTLSGTGTIELQPAGTVTLQEPLTTPGLTFQLDGGATLNILAAIAAANTIDLSGTANTVTIDDQYYVMEQPYTGYSGGPPIVNATINGFNSSDSLMFVDDFQNDITITSVNYAGAILSLLNGSTVVSTYSLAGDYSGDTFSVGAATASAFVAETQQAITVACFAAGTRIATPRGAIAIEHLREGDAVLTVSGRQQPIQWIGQRSLDCRRHPAPKQIIPIRIARHAFGENRPKRALLLSPDHAVFIDDVLIPIKYLLNGTTIARNDVATITYYHIGLPRHDVVLAEGLPTESYLETGGRSNFENGGGAMRLYPDFAADPRRLSAMWEYAGYAPLIVTGGACDRVRARLAVQALMLGYQGDRGPLRAKRRAGR